jgi:hypothetical protein
MLDPQHLINLQASKARYDERKYKKTFFEGWAGVMKRNEKPRQGAREGKKVGNPWNNRLGEH